jgi:lipoprotein-anchoring transpeptidase ErfK/SrfK
LFEMSCLPEEIAVTVRGKSQSQSFMLVCLSAAILMLSVQRQAAASLPIEGVTAISEPRPQSPWLLEEPQLPPLGVPSLYLPSEEGTTEATYLVIKLSDRRVYVYQNNKLKVSYPIAVGKAGWETPTGSYKVINMQRNPAWQSPMTGEVIPPGADNPLGARWIGFWTDGHNFIGFHGTPDEQLVGQAVSHGCIRMRNQDILALFAQVGIGTPVQVEP